MQGRFCLCWHRLSACAAHAQLWALPDLPSHVAWEGWDHIGVEFLEKRCCHPLWQQGYVSFEGIWAYVKIRSLSHLLVLDDLSLDPQDH